jgi:hypothetical protein
MAKTSKKSTHPKKSATTTATLKPPRMIKAPTYSSFKLQRKIRPTSKPLIGSFRLLKESLDILKLHWKPFAGIIAVYALLTILLVKGFDITSNLGTAKDTLSSNGTGELATGAALFSYLLGGSGETKGPSSALFQVILTVITSLAIIWALRQAYAKNIIKVRESFYKGMYPLIPYVLVGLVIILQLLPMAAGLFLYNIVLTVTSTGIELFAWAALLFFLTVLSLYMLSSSLFALYVVSLPDMPPLQALRSASELVRYRRWSVLRKLLFLPFALVVIGAVIMIPFILWLTPIAGLVFFGMSMTFLAVAHSYMYRLYRELI